MKQPELGQALLVWRKAEGLSRAKVGELTGFPAQKIQSIEEGRKLKVGQYEQLTEAIPDLLCPELSHEELRDRIQETYEQITQDLPSITVERGGVKYPTPDNADEDAYLIDLAEKAKASSTGTTPMAEVLASIEAEESDCSPPLEEVTIGISDILIPLDNETALAADVETFKKYQEDFKKYQEEWENLEPDPEPEGTRVPEFPTAKAIFDYDVISEQIDEIGAGLPELEPAKLTAPVSAVDSSDARPVSNSEVQTFKRCRRKWWLTWYRRLKLEKRNPTGALAIGTRVHLALAALYDPSTRDHVNPFDVLERAVVEDWTTYTKALEASGEEVSADVVKKFSSDTDLERIILKGYLNWLGETGADEDLDFIAAETYVEAPLDLPPALGRVKLIGKLDARARRLTDGVTLFMDHKTVQNFSDPTNTLKQDEQMLHYHLLEWLSDTESGRCDGALYNMLRKVKQTPAAKPPFYLREEVLHNRRELESFKARLIGVVSDMLAVEARLRAGEDPNVVVYPSPNRNCHWDCDFFRVCHMFDDGSRAEAMLADQYVERDPFSHYADTRKDNDI